MAETQGGTLNYFWAVRYGAPCQSRTGVIIANVGQEAPCRFSGYSTVTPTVATPTLPATELGGMQKADLA